MNLVNRKLEILCVVAFVVINLVGPMVVGEMYPFTISPMFSDQPSQYSVYEVFDENGQPIDSEPFGLHLVYDGNPPGLGMGCLLYTSPSPRDQRGSRMPSSA